MEQLPLWGGRPAVTLRNSIPLLSKSRFMAGLQCHKRLYLECYPSVSRDPVSPATRALFEAGARVGAVARGLFAGGVRIGEDVVAIGNALNLDGAPSITRGVVSAVGRDTATLQGVIQTDAAISSGSSGGALVDDTGAVIGITTEALVGDPSVSVEDIAFAIPSERVQTVLGGMGLALRPGR